MLHHFTTIIPFGIEKQLEQLKTWHDAHGRPIYTLNHSREIARIKDHLPEWVIPLERRFAQSYGRDYLPFTELHSAGREIQTSPVDRILLVNSDISIRDASQIAKLEQNDADLVFASRIDVTENGLPTERYTKGYDVFSLSAGALDILNMSEFYMGIPWWDYIVPLTAIMEDYSVVRLDTEAFEHIIHPQRWSLISFDHIGWKCIQRLLPKELSAGEPSHDRVLAFAQITNRFLNEEVPSTNSAVSEKNNRDRFLYAVRSEPRIMKSENSFQLRPTTNTDASAQTPKIPAFSTLKEEIELLKCGRSCEVVGGHLNLSSNIWLSCDPNGKANLTCRSVDGELEFGVDNGESGQWACLGMQIDPQVLRSGKYLGIQVIGSSSTPCELVAMLRYYPKSEDFIDIPLSPSLSLNSSQHKVISITEIDQEISNKSGKCELNLFFRENTTKCRFNLIEPVLLS